MLRAACARGSCARLSRARSDDGFMDRGNGPIERDGGARHGRRAPVLRRTAALLSCSVAIAVAARAGAVTTPTPWSVSVATYTYILRHDRDYVNPNVYLDRDWTHVEARFNYEDLDTASLWAGYNFDGGTDLVYQVTPMVGAVFGHLNGVAPGYAISLAYKGLLFSGQGEYVFDAQTRASDFFYAWTELSYTPVHRMRFGAAMQHTKAFDTGLDVERGPLLGFSYGRFDFTVYVFNVDKPDPPVVLGIGASF